jgi:Tfp pilus assembly protein FimT
MWEDVMAWINLLFLAVGAVLTFAVTYIGKWIETTRLRAKGDLLADLAARRLNAAVELVRHWNSVGWALDITSFGAKVLILDEGNRRTEGDSDAVKAQRKEALKAVTEFYDFMAKNSAIFGPEVMRVFHWFDVQFKSLQMRVSIERHNDITNDIVIGEVARGLMLDAQGRFYTSVEELLRGAGLKLLQPAEIQAARGDALKELEILVAQGLQQYADM